LLAARAGTEIFIESDDDNIPLWEFWRERHRSFESPVLQISGWANVYSLFTNNMTCNAVEWIYSYGGGTVVDPDKKVTINNPNALIPGTRNPALTSISVVPDAKDR
jgi:hypothetical protein